MANTNKDFPNPSVVLKILQIGRHRDAKVVLVINLTNESGEHATVIT